MSSFIESYPEGTSCLGPMAGLEKQREQYAHAAELLSNLKQTRLMIYKTVIKAGYPGITVGKIQEKLDIPNSTLSHYLSTLISAGLSTQRRERTILYCVAGYEILQSVIGGYLQDECYIDEKSTGD